MAASRSLARLAYRGLALGCIGLGALGAVLPLLPTTPFLLVAAWAAPKGSPRLACWLWRHPRLGPVLVAWHEQRAVPRGAKALACGLLALSFALLALGGVAPLMLAVLGGLFAAVATFILTRPTAAPPSRVAPSHRAPSGR